MKHVIIATKNAGKAGEFRQLFQPYGVTVKSLLDFPDAEDVAETGTTFTENAILKAEAIAAQYGEATIADDSGLAIDILSGRPGVYSARYAGEEKNDQANIDKVLSQLEGTSLQQRTAHFHCVLAASVPRHQTETFSGTCDGLITQERIGKGGFGYDPIFYIPDKGRTMAALTNKEKNQISHRAIALGRLIKNWRFLDQ